MMSTFLNAHEAREHVNSLRRNMDVAVFYAGNSIPVFPAIPDGPNAKAPMAKHGHHDATTDVDRVKLSWQRNPSALVAIPAGYSSGVWALDIDGEDGVRSLRNLLKGLGLSSPFDLTPCVARTPRPGFHLYFQLQEGERPRNRAKDIGPGLDTRGVKADGTSAGYFIAPGTRLMDGRRYEWLSLDYCDWGWDQ